MISPILVAAFLAIIFYVVDDSMGIVMAIVLPNVAALDTTDYSAVLVVTLFGAAMLFFKRITSEKE